MVVQMKRKANNFKSWQTKELKEWCEGAMLLPDILTAYIFDTCLQATEELNEREGVYEEFKVLHRC